MPVTALTDKLELTFPDTEGGISARLIPRFGHVPKPNEIDYSDDAEFMVRGRLEEKSLKCR